jgi:hypothetical protein
VYLRIFVFIAAPYKAHMEISPNKSLWNEEIETNESGEVFVKPLCEMIQGFKNEGSSVLAVKE